MPIDLDANEPAAQACRNFADRHHGRVAAFLRAARIGETTWNDWLNERTTVPSWAPARLYAVSGDVQWFAEVTGAQDVGLVIATVSIGGSADDLRTEALEVTRLDGELAGAVIEAAADGHVDIEDARKVDARCNALEAAAEHIRQTARTLARKPVTVAAYRRGRL